MSRIISFILLSLPICAPSQWAAEFDPRMLGRVALDAHAPGGPLGAEIRVSANRRCGFHVTYSADINIGDTLTDDTRLLLLYTVPGSHYIDIAELEASMRALPNVRLLAVDRNPNPELTSTQSSAHLFAVELADLVTMGGENGLPGPFVRYSFPARLRYPTAGNRSGHVETELPAPTVYMSQSADAACREMAGDFDEAMIPPPLSHGAAESIVESGDGLCQSAPSASLESVVVVNVPVGGSQDLLVVLIVTSLCQVMLAAAVAQQLWQLNTLSRQNKE